MKSIHCLTLAFALGARTNGFGQATLQFSTTSYSVPENAGNAVLTVLRSGALGQGGYCARSRNYRTSVAAECRLPSFHPQHEIPREMEMGNTRRGWPGRLRLESLRC